MGCSSCSSSLSSSAQTGDAGRGHTAAGGSSPHRKGFPGRGGGMEQAGPEPGEMCIRDSRRANPQPPPRLGYRRYPLCEAGWPGTVSYTHLDVYKRQMLLFQAAGVMPTSPAISPTFVFRVSNIPVRFEMIPSMSSSLNHSWICLLYTSRCV